MHVRFGFEAILVTMLIPVLFQATFCVLLVPGLTEPSHKLFLKREVLDETSKHDKLIHVISQDSIVHTLWSLNLEIHHIYLFTLAILVTASGVISILIFMISSLLLTLRQLKNL